MTPDGPYERYAAQFALTLHEATATRPAWRAVRAPLAGAGALAALVLAGVLVLSPSDGPLDAVAKARAALAAPGEIVHTKTTIIPEQPTSEQELCRTRVERWQTEDPLRSRQVSRPILPRPQCRLYVGGELDAGRAETAYADGVQQTYIPSEDKLFVLRGLPENFARPLGGYLEVNPITEIRQMLAAGDLRDRGQRTLSHGRRVRLLSGDRNGPQPPIQTIEYLVDADTFAPVRASFELPPRSPGQPPFPTTTTRIDIELYERIPLNEQTAKLLTITPDRPPEVQRRTFSRDKP